jgi:hypothetical protein
VTAKDIIAALQLPEHARINQRISKKLLIENIMPTVGGRQQINDGIEEIYWIAALKPVNCGIPDFRDAQREYVEVVVLHIVLRPDARAGKIVELLHRSVPHPALLLISQQDSIQLSLSHKRWAQNEAGKIVLEGTIFTESLPQPSQLTMAFLNVMGIDHQPRRNLKTFYQGWIETLQALQAAQHTGSFLVAKCQLDATARHVALQVCNELESKILALRSRAQKTQQIARQIELNLQLKQLQQALGEAQTKL